MEHNRFLATCINTIASFAALHLAVLVIDSAKRGDVRALYLSNILDLHKVMDTPALFNTLWFSFIIYGAIFSAFYLSGRFRK